MLDALENHTASADWQDAKVIPGMEKWLNGEYWLQRLSPTSAAPANKWEANLPEFARKARERARAAQS
jgi:hypothetical protein